MAGKGRLVLMDDTAENSANLLCENCRNYVYDEDYDEFVCSVNMDEDELVRLLYGSKFECGYYSPTGDESSDYLA